MSDPAAYLLAPQQERVIDGLARRQPEDAREGAAAGVCGGGAFRVQLVVRPASPIGAETLTTRVRTALGRHPILRLRLAPRPGARRPLQRCERETTDVPIVTQSKDRIELVCRAEWTRPFDLTAEPPLRIVCVADGEAPERLVLTAPAAVLDTRAALDLARELCGGVPLAVADGPEALDWLGARPSFASASRTRKTRSRSSIGPTLPRRRRCRHLAASHGAGGGCGGRGNGLRPGVGSARRGVAAAIADEAQRAALPEDMLWLAAFDAFLARTSVLARPIVRVASDGRAMEELESVLGPLGRWLPVAVEVDRRSSVTTLAGALARAVATAREHELGHRDPDPLHPGGGPHAELDACAFAWTDTRLDGVGTVEAIRAVEVDAPIVARLSRHDGPGPHGAVALVLEIDRDRIGEQAAEDVAASLGAWLASIARAPEAAIRDHRLLEPGPAQDRALGGPDRAAQEQPALFPARFAAAAATHPDRAAVVADAATLTYADLERRSRLLAARLRAAGAGPSGRSPS